MKKNICIIIILVIIDQLIKLLVIRNLGEVGQNFEIIPNVLSIMLVQNLGAAFGILYYRLFLIGVDLVVIFVVTKILLTKKYPISNKTKLGLTLIIAGGFGNLIDRVFRGYVIDYIDINKVFEFPVFNFADILIVIGVIIVFTMILINTIKSQENMNEGIQSKWNK